MKEVFYAMVGAVGVWVAVMVGLVVWGAQCRTDGGYAHSGARPDVLRWCEEE